MLVVREALNKLLLPRKHVGSPLLILEHDYGKSAMESRDQNEFHIKLVIHSRTTVIIGIGGI